MSLNKKQKENIENILKTSLRKKFENHNPEPNIMPFHNHPEPYNRWTMRGMIDLKEELKVAEEFWDFLGGKNTYNDLLKCFENVGIEMRNEIDKYFKRFK